MDKEMASNAVEMKNLQKQINQAAKYQPQIAESLKKKLALYKARQEWLSQPSAGPEAPKP